MGQFKVGKARTFGQPRSGGKIRALPRRAEPPARGPFNARVRDGDPRSTTIYGEGGKAMFHMSTAQCNVNGKAAIDWVLAALNAARTVEANIQVAQDRYRYDKPESFYDVPPPKGSKFP